MRSYLSQKYQKLYIIHVIQNLEQIHIIILDIYFFIEIFRCILLNCNFFNHYTYSILNLKKFLNLFLFFMSKIYFLTLFYVLYSINKSRTGTFLINATCFYREISPLEKPLSTISVIIF